MQVFGITGRKQHGKDTVTRELVLKGYELLRFADPLKNMLRAFYETMEVPSADIERRIEGDLKEVPCIYLNGKTPRHAMQTLGTEWGRGLIHEDLWVDSRMRRAAGRSKVVISDVRFPNECATVKRLDGKIVRVDASKRVAFNEFSNHLSETQIDALPADVEIDNNGTRFELSCAVQMLTDSSD